MSAPHPWWKRPAFADPYAAQRRLTLGAIVSVAVTVFGRWLYGMSPELGPLPFLSVVTGVLVLTLPTWNRWLRLATLVTAVVLAVMAHANERTLPFALSAALGLCLAMEPREPGRRALAAVGPSLGVAWAMVAVKLLSARYLGVAKELSWVALAVSGVFIALGGLLGSLTLLRDAVESRLRFREPGVRDTWRRLQAAVQRFSPGAREKLSTLAAMVASRWLDAQEEQHELEVAMMNERFTAAQEAVERLTARLERVEDAEVRAHLEQSVRVHRDTLEQLEGLRRRGERAEARAAAELTWLDTAALTLELTPANDGPVRDATERLSSLALRAA